MSCAGTPVPDVDEGDASSTVCAVGVADPRAGADEGACPPSGGTAGADAVPDAGGTEAGWSGPAGNFRPVGPPWPVGPAVAPAPDAPVVEAGSGEGDGGASRARRVAVASS